MLAMFINSLFRKFAIQINKNLTIIPQAYVGYEMVDSQRGTKAPSWL